MATQSGFEGSKDMAEGAVKDLVSDDDLAALKGDISKLQGDFKKLFSDVSELAQKKTKKSIDMGKETADEAKETLDEKRSELETMIRENPLASVGIALGAGAVVAMIMKR